MSSRDGPLGEGQGFSGSLRDRKKGSLLANIIVKELSPGPRGPGGEGLVAKEPEAVGRRREANGEKGKGGGAAGGRWRPPARKKLKGIEKNNLGGGRDFRLTGDIAKGLAQVSERSRRARPHSS